MAIDRALLQIPENRILLGCARGSHESEQFASALGEVLDWERLVWKLNFNRLTLLFLHHLRGHEALVPNDVLQELQRTGEQILHWNLFLLAELQQVTQILVSEGIRVLSYKGPSIAYTAYNTLALRRFADLDFLVSPQDRAKVVSVLAKRDYHKVVRRSALTPYVERHKKKIEYEFSLVSEDGLVNLDVHWSVAAPFEDFPLDFAQLWQLRSPVPSIPGVEALCREDVLIALCFHGLKHRWEELEWLGCLLGLLESGRKAPLNWVHIEQSMESSGCERIVHVGLRLACDLARANNDHPLPDDVVPARFRHQMNRRRVTRIGKTVWGSLLSDKSTQPKSSFQLSIQQIRGQLFLGLRTRTGWKRKWKFFCGLVRTSLVSCEHSKVVLNIVKPLLKLKARMGNN